jgi:hypothetical protein
LSYIYEHGNGTLTNPYQIWTVNDLDGVRYHLNSIFTQMADIDLIGINWNPIALNTEFTGIYMGNGRKIINLTINTIDTLNNVGLFSCLKEAGFLYNIHLVNVNINAPNSNQVGALVGYKEGRCSVYRCCSYGSVIGNNQTGGLIGRHRTGNIVDCFSFCNITGSNEVGGLVGRIDTISGLNARIYSSYSKGFVTGITNTGGLVGIKVGTSAFIQDCYYNIETSGQNDTGKGHPKTTSELTYPHIERNIGYNPSDQVYNGWYFYSVWKIEEGINDNYPFLITYYYEHGKGIQSDPYQIWTVEDLKGVHSYMCSHFIQMADIDVNYEENWKPIGCTMYGFEGCYNGNYYKIKNIVINHSLYIFFYVGFFGYIGPYYTRGRLFSTVKLEKIQIENIQIDNTEWGDAGGLIGGVSRSNNMPLVFINKCSVVNANIIGGQYAGMLIGSYWNIPGSYSIDECFATGRVECPGVAGGLIGMGGYALLLENSYARGEVTLGNSYTTGWSCVGGLVGWLDDDSWIYDSYFEGNLKVWNGRLVGGAVGVRIFETTQVENCFYTGNIYDETANFSQGTGEYLAPELLKSEEYMKSVWQYYDYYWTIDPNYNNGFPMLKSFEYPFTGSFSAYNLHFIVKDRLNNPLQDTKVFVTGENIKLTNSLGQTTFESVLPSRRKKYNIFLKGYQPIEEQIDFE